MPTLVVNVAFEAWDVYIGRGSIWGNPWSHLSKSKAKCRAATREIAVEEYAKWIQTQPHLLAKIRELRNLRLGCYCSPKRCHGEILAELADALPDIPVT